MYSLQFSLAQIKIFRVSKVLRIYKKFYFTKTEENERNNIDPKFQRKVSNNIDYKIY